MKEAGKLRRAQREQDTTLHSFLLPGETICYHADNIYFTNQRIIKFTTSRISRALRFSYNTFEDLSLGNLESIRAQNIMNIQLFVIGIIALLLGPVAYFISLLPLIGFIGDFLVQSIVEDLGFGGLLLISIILIISSIILRDRIITFKGAQTSITAAHFYDEELSKIRILQKAYNNKSQAK